MVAIGTMSNYLDRMVLEIAAPFLTRDRTDRDVDAPCLLRVLVGSWRGIARTVFVASAVLVSRQALAQTQPVPLTELIPTAYLDSRAKLLQEIGNLTMFTAPVDLGPFDTAGVMSSAIVQETAAFPIGSSSGGFAYAFDTTSGTAIRSSPSFGPLFAERPLTSGRGKLNVGMTYLHRSFNELEGKGLKDGSLTFFVPLNYRGTDSAADLMQSTMNLRLRSDTMTLFATYGLLNKLDVSVAAPIQHVSLDAVVTSQLVRFGPSSGIPNSEIPSTQTTRSGDASGIGDVAVRAKYNLFNGPGGAVAAGLDIRLPTGDETNLLGTGRTRTKVYAAVSSAMSKLFPHANFGYTFQSDANDNDPFFFGSEFSYAAGAEYVVHPRLTVVGDILGRSLAGEGRLQDKATTFQLVPTFATPAATITTSQLTYQSGLRLNTTLAAIGAKFNPGSTFIVSGHALVTLTSNGIKSGITPVLSVDYSF